MWAMVLLVMTQSASALIDDSVYADQAALPVVASDDSQAAEEVGVNASDAYVEDASYLEDEEFGYSSLDGDQEPEFKVCCDTWLGCRWFQGGCPVGTTPVPCPCEEDD